jgi:3-mercaptopyruvate sulfurtransferase SseA
LVNAGKKKVLVFMGGWPEWTTSGYPIAKGATPEGA